MAVIVLAASSTGACGSGEPDRRSTAGAARTDGRAACEVTRPNGDIPPGQAGNPGAERAPYFGNGRLWTVLPDEGAIRRAKRPDGSIAEKVPWWRGVRGRLTIIGRRLDGPAPPLRAHIPAGYGQTGFQATGLIFPTTGCWALTAAAGAAQLRLVIAVVDADAS